MKIFQIIAGMGIAAILWVAMFTPDSGPIRSEEDPRWDCLTMGNRACRIDGHLVVNIDDMPEEPYARCLYLLDISSRLGGIEYTPENCALIGENR